MSSIEQMLIIVMSSILTTICFNNLNSPWLNDLPIFRKDNHIVPSNIAMERVVWPINPSCEPSILLIIIRVHEILVFRRRTAIIESPVIRDIFIADIGTIKFEMVASQPDPVHLDVHRPPETILSHHTLTTIII